VPEAAARDASGYMTGVRVEPSINCGILQVLLCLHVRMSQRWQDSINFSRAENNLRAHTEHQTGVMRGLLIRRQRKATAA
jgi:hypothetical protein